jgi:hypothetical protein
LVASFTNGGVVDHDGTPVPLLTRTALLAGVTVDHTPAVTSGIPVQPVEFCPVPPYWLAIAVAFHVPPVIVPPVTVRPLSVPVVVKLPELLIVNLVCEEALAVIRSPTPSLLITKVAKLVLPEIEATPKVPAPKILAVNLNLADEEA